MSSFWIMPYESLIDDSKEIKFTDDRATIQSKYKLSKSLDDNYSKEDVFMDTDYYFHATYDTNNIVDAVLFFPPSNPYYLLISFFNYSYLVFLQQSLIDDANEIIYVADGFFDFALGIYCRSEIKDKKQKLDSPPTMVMVFRRGRFDKYRDQMQQESEKWKIKSDQVLRVGIDL